MEDCLVGVFVANDEKCNKHCDCIDHELKICYIPEAYESGYNKAIDDFLNKSRNLCCCEERFCINGHVLECEKCSSYTAEYSRLVELAEKLKGGKHDRV